MHSTPPPSPPVVLCDRLFTIIAYRNEEGKPWVLPVVHRVEMSMANDESLNKEYLPVAGLADFTVSSTRLLLSGDCVAMQEQRVSLCITGTLREKTDANYNTTQRKSVNIALNREKTFKEVVVLRIVC